MPRRTVRARPTIEAHSGKGEAASSPGRGVEPTASERDVSVEVRKVRWPRPTAVGFRARAGAEGRERGAGSRGRRLVERPRSPAIADAPGPARRGRSDIVDEMGGWRCASAEIVLSSPTSTGEHLHPLHLRPTLA